MDVENTSTSRLSGASRLIVWATVAVYALPAVVDLVGAGARGAFRWLAADAFYYLTIARNMSDQGLVSFDGERATNGFHPLWQMLAGGLYGVSDGLGVSADGILLVTILANVALIALALLLLGRAMFAAQGRVSVWFLTLPVGAYAFVVSPLWWRLDAAQTLAQSPYEGAQPLYGTLWSYANGMESAVTLLMFAVVVYWWVTQPVLTSRRHALALGGLLALLTLARLDHFFLPLTVLGLLGVRWLLLRTAAAFRPLLWASVAFAAPIALYLIVNKLTVGSAFPVSGSLKTTFPHLSNWLVDMSGQFLDNFGSDRLYVVFGWRLAQVVVPVVAALAYLATAVRVRVIAGGLALSLRREDERFEQILGATAVATLLLAAYNGFFVEGLAQGHWYFPVSVLFTGLVLVRWLDGSKRLARLLTSVRARVAVGTVLVGVAGLYFAALHHQDSYHQRFADFFYDEVPRLRAHYGEQPPRLFSVDDGIVAWATGFPTMSGTGLALDGAAIAAYKEGRLGNLAVARGYDRMTSLVYLPVGGIAPNRPSGSIAAAAAGWFRLQTPQRYHFSVDYRSEDGRFGILRVEDQTLVAGGGGGHGTDFDCPPGEVLGGLSGQYAEFVHTLRPVCRRLHWSAPTAGPPQLTGELAAGAQGPAFGGPPVAGRSDRELSCPAGEVVVGLHGSLGRFVREVGLSCADPRDIVAGRAPELHRTASIGAAGDDAGEPFALRCPPGTVATAYRGRAGELIDAIGLACGVPTPR